MNIVCRIVKTIFNNVISKSKRNKIIKVQTMSNGSKTTGRKEWSSLIKNKKKLQFYKMKLNIRKKIFVKL